MKPTTLSPWHPLPWRIMTQHHQYPDDAYYLVDAHGNPIIGGKDTLKLIASSANLHERLVEALKKYGAHDWNCAFSFRQDAKCTCGFEEARALLAECEKGA